MSLRISFDIDGVLADFASAYREVEVRLFGRESDAGPDQPEEEEARQEKHVPPPPGRNQAIWRAIESTPDFWTTVKPLDAGAIKRIQDLGLAHRWEVFFITQRPETAGETVQRQTQRWLAQHGIEFPSVLVLGGARGSAIRALRVNYHVDDSTQHCLDVIADSTAKTILVSASAREAGIVNTKKLGIAPVAGIAQALDILEQATLAKTNPTLLQRLYGLVGWK